MQTKRPQADRTVDPQNTLLNELLDTLNLLSQNKKHITRLSNKFLDRLGSIWGKSKPIYLPKETIKNTIQMLEAIEQNIGTPISPSQ